MITIARRTFACFRAHGRPAPAGCRTTKRRVAVHGVRDGSGRVRVANLVSPATRCRRVAWRVRRAMGKARGRLRRGCHRLLRVGEIPAPSSSPLPRGDAADIVLLVHSETSTGGRRRHRSSRRGREGGGALVVADAVSSLGACRSKQMRGGGRRRLRLSEGADDATGARRSLRSPAAWDRCDKRRHRVLLDWPLRSRSNCLEPVHGRCERPGLDVALAYLDDVSRDAFARHAVSGARAVRREGRWPGALSPDTRALRRHGNLHADARTRGLCSSCATVRISRGGTATWPAPLSQSGTYGWFDVFDITTARRSSSSSRIWARRSPAAWPVTAHSSYAEKPCPAVKC